MLPGTLATFSSLDSLPEACQPLFEAAGRRSFFCSRPWFRLAIDHALPAGIAPALAVYSEHGRPLALVPLQVRHDGLALKSLTNPYTCLWQPLLHPDANADALRRAGRALGAHFRRWPTVRLDAIDPELPGLPAVLEGVRAAGLLLHHFDFFGNWHEPVADRSWQQYLDSRPGALRETIRRKLRRNDRGGHAVFQLITSPDEVESGIAAYTEVYARSWKKPEPFPEFNPQLMRVAAGLGVLRLGVLRVGGATAAAQYWIVTDGIASVLKLAHDEAMKAHSPGTVLTALMIRHLIERDGVTELDFGRGDDPYKRLWVGRRRQRIGIMLISSRRVGGLLYLGRRLLARAYGLVRGGGRIARPSFDLPCRSMT
jgi:CelD/BcsL family acetyltransferase involved in cellulose biosynthesis